MNVPIPPMIVMGIVLRELFSECERYTEGRSKVPLKGEGLPLDCPT